MYTGINNLINVLLLLSLLVFTFPLKLLWSITPHLLKQFLGTKGGPCATEKVKLSPQRHTIISRLSVQRFLMAML